MLEEHLRSGNFSLSPFSDPLQLQVILAENLGKKAKLLMSELGDFICPGFLLFQRRDSEK